MILSDLLGGGVQKRECEVDNFRNLVLVIKHHQIFIGDGVVYMILNPHKMRKTSSSGNEKPKCYGTRCVYRNTQCGYRNTRCVYC